MTLHRSVRPQSFAMMMLSRPGLSLEEASTSWTLRRFIEVTSRLTEREVQQLVSFLSDPNFKQSEVPKTVYQWKAAKNFLLRTLQSESFDMKTTDGVRQRRGTLKADSRPENHKLQVYAASQHRR